MFRNRHNRLFERFRDHADGEALGLLFDKTAPRLFKLACHLVREPTVAEDLVQSTFLVAVAHPEKFDGSGPVEGWLYGILWREAARTRRQAARRPESLETEPVVESEPLAALLSEETRTAVAEVIARLPARHREVLEPFLCGEQRPEEIALALGRAPSTVRTQIYRAMERLRRALPRSLEGLPVVVGGSLRGLGQVRSEILRQAVASSRAGVLAPSTVAGISLGAILITKQAIALLGLALLFAGWMLWRSKPEQDPRTQVASLDAPSAVETVSTPPPLSSKRAGSRSPVEADPVQAPPKPAELAFLTIHAVTQSSHSPLPNVRVSVMHPDPDGGGASGGLFVDGTEGTVESSPITGRDGVVTLKLPPGETYTLYIAGEDGGSGRADRTVPPLAVGERGDLVVELPTGNDLHYFCRVLASGSKLPIVGALAEVVQRTGMSLKGSDGQVIDQTADKVLSQNTSDGQGFIEIWMPSWEELDIRVRAPGFGMVILQPASQHETPEQSKQVVLKAASTLHAVILDSHGQPDPAASVRLTTETLRLCMRDSFAGYYPQTKDPVWEASTDRAGIAVLKDLAPDVPLHAVITFGDGSVQSEQPEFILSPGESREVQWRKDDGCTVQGTMADQYGQVVRGVTIWMMPAEHSFPYVFEVQDRNKDLKTTTTDADGRFSVTAVSPGKWWIGPAADESNAAKAEDIAIAPVAQTLLVESSASRKTVDLRVYRGLYIRGRVLLPDGEAAPSADLRCESESCGILFLGRSRADGAFALGPLIPGSYLVTAKGGGRSPKYADSERVEADAAQRGVVLQLRLGGSISGHVVDSASRDPARVMIHYLRRGTVRGGWVVKNGRFAEWRGGPETGSMEMDIPNGGVFTLQGLIDGVYDVVLTGAEGQVAVLRAISVQGGVDADGQVVRFAPSARILVKNARKESELLCTAYSGDAWAGNSMINRDESEEVTVPSGHILLRAEWGDGATAMKEVDIAGGESNEVVFGGQ